jgi:deoxycytidylate deaminase
MMEKIGPGYWHHIHTKAADNADVCMSMFNSLPCNDCKTHSIQLYDTLKPAYEGDILGLTIAIHNEVNRKLGKRQLSQKEARALYVKTKPCRNCGSNKTVVTPVSSTPRANPLLISRRRVRYI